MKKQVQHTKSHAKLITSGFTAVWCKTTNQFINEIIHSLSSLDQQDDPPGLLQLGHHVLQGLGSDHFGALSLVLQEVVDLGHSSVVGADLLDRLFSVRGTTEGPSGNVSQQKWRPHHKAMVVHVHDEVLAHNGQTNKCNVCSVETRGITFTKRP